jgi:hypothetical protein
MRPMNRFRGPIYKQIIHFSLKKVNPTFLMRQPFSDAGADEEPGTFFMWPKLNTYSRNFVGLFYIKNFQIQYNIYGS